jgi:hypothetical protein
MNSAAALITKKGIGGKMFQSVSLHRCCEENNSSNLFVLLYSSSSQVLKSSEIKEKKIIT